MCCLSHIPRSHQRHHTKVQQRQEDSQEPLCQVSSVNSFSTLHASYVALYLTNGLENNSQWVVVRLQIKMMLK